MFSEHLYIRQLFGRNDQNTWNVCSLKRNSAVYCSSARNAIFVLLASKLCNIFFVFHFDSRCYLLRSSLPVCENLERFHQPTQSFTNSKASQNHLQWFRLWLPNKTLTHCVGILYFRIFICVFDCNFQAICLWRSWRWYPWDMFTVESNFTAWCNHVGIFCWMQNPKQKYFKKNWVTFVLSVLEKICAEDNDWDARSVIWDIGKNLHFKFTLQLCCIVFFAFYTWCKGSSFKWWWDFDI